MRASSTSNECTGGKGKDAIAACTRIIEDADEAAKLRGNAYFNRAGVREMENDPDGAVADYTEAIKLDPWDRELLRGARRSAAAQGSISRRRSPTSTWR